jgi:uncharacterized protein YggE
MNKNISLTILLTVALLFFAAALYLYRPAHDNHTRVSIVGESQTTVEPDTAALRFPSSRRTRGRSPRSRKTRAKATP